MKNLNLNIKIILTLLAVLVSVLLFAPQISFAAENPESDFNWSDDGGGSGTGTTILGFSKNYYSDTIVIPSRCTCIARNAFLGKTQLKYVTISDSVTSIGDSAFYGVNTLKTLTLSKNLTSIGVSAFQGCSGLTGLTIPDSVTSIGDSAFSGCSGLASVSISNTLTTIGNNVFQGCSGLTGLTIPNSVTAIGNNAFNYCNNILTLTIPNSVTTIGNDAFGSCWKLTSLTIPNSVTSLGTAAFYDCGFTSLNLSNTLTTIPTSAFAHCTGLTSVTIPSSVTTIGDSVFQDCTGLTTLTIPDTVTSIGGKTFSGCTELTSAAIGKGVTSIGTFVFDLCNKLTSITVDASNSTYESNNGVLLDKANKIVVRYPGGKSGDFVIPNGYTKIADYAFTSCPGLTGVTIPTGITDIGAYAFNECSGLTNVTIPNTVTFIGSDAFIDCSGITGAISIPASVTNMSFDAFYNCSKLTDINVDTNNNTYISINGVVFAQTQTYDSTKDKLIMFPPGKSGAYTVPSGILMLGKQAFDGCNKLTGVTIPGSVKSVSVDVFRGCTALTNVLVQGGRTKAEADSLLSYAGIVDPSIITVDGAQQTAAPSANSFVIVNNKVGTADTVTYTGTEGDIIKIYSTASGGTALGTATVASGQTKAVIKVTQLGTTAGNIYATLATGTTIESTRVQVPYSAEAGGTTGGTKPQATAPSASSFVIVNNVGTVDTITYTGTAGDIIKIYTSDSIATVLGTGTIAAGKTTVVITKSLGETVGSIYATLTTSTATESTRTKLDFSAVQKTTAPDVDKITVKNNYVGTSDTVEVTGLAVGDIIKAYDKDTSGKVLGTAAVAASSTSATIKIGQLGKTAGSVYITLLSKGKQESAATKVDYIKEPTTTAPIFGTGSDNQITITNKADIADTVKVTGLLTGDIIKVYDKPTTDNTAKSIGTVTVAALKTEATVSIKQLAPSAASTSGSVYVTVKTKGKQESDSTKADYIAEQKTTGIDAQKVLIVNDEASDLIVVWGLKAGDIIKVYKTATPLTKDDMLCTGTVGKTKTFVSLAVKQLGADAGDVYITVKRSGYLESDPTTVAFGTEN